MAAWLVAAQIAYPIKPIKIVVPFPVGGTSDMLARMLGQKFTGSWGQPVVVENRLGSSGNLAISPALFKLPFTVEKDFVPVARVAYSPHLLAVSTKVPANTLAELVVYAKAQKGKFNDAVAAGVGSVHPWRA